MDENFKKQMEENGADVDATLRRFMGNEKLYMKFIMKFLEDENYDGIISNLEKCDYDAAFNNAHTLKGVTANLGITPVCAAAGQITELLRNRQSQEVDVEKLNESKAALEESYQRFTKILEENRQG